MSRKCERQTSVSEMAKKRDTWHFWHTISRFINQCAPNALSKFPSLPATSNLKRGVAGHTSIQGRQIHGFASNHSDMHVCSPVEYLCFNCDVVCMMQGSLVCDEGFLIMTQLCVGFSHTIVQPWILNNIPMPTSTAVEQSVGEFSTLENIMTVDRTISNLNVVFWHIIHF